MSDVGINPKSNSNHGRIINGDYICYLPYIPSSNYPNSICFEPSLSARQFTGTGGGTISSPNWLVGNNISQTNFGSISPYGNFIYHSAGFNGGNTGSIPGAATLTFDSNSNSNILILPNNAHNLSLSAVNNAIYLQTGSLSSNIQTNSVCIGTGAYELGGSNVVIGINNQAYATSIAIGTSAYANNSGAIAIGKGNAYGCTASGAGSIAIGGNMGALATYTNAIAIGSSAQCDFQGEININNASFANMGDIHVSNFPIYQYTTGATATEFATGQTYGSLTPTTYIALVNNASYIFNIDIIAQTTGGHVDSSMWTLIFGIQRGATAAATALVGTPVLTVVGQTAGATTWAVAVTADTTNGRPAIKITGVAATNISWVANVRMTKVGY